jgi:dTDP-4-amino-4,6-dideoxygalactose transaminase
VIQVPDRARVRRQLARSGVETGIHYPVACHRQEAYAQWSPGPLPVAELMEKQRYQLSTFSY